MRNCNLLINLVCLFSVAWIVSCKTGTTEPSAEQVETENLVLKSGGVYNIPVGSITDHSNASTVGSIAWYFATYGSSNIYNLSSNAIYLCNSTLFIPVNSTLGEASGVSSASIRPSVSWGADGSTYLIGLNNWSCVKDIELNGLFIAKHVVHAGSVTGAQVRNCTVHRSAKVTDGHLIVFSGTQSCTIDNNLLRRASCDTEVNFARKADLVYTLNCTGVNITNNDMAIAASSGICFSGSVNVNISNNVIHDCGRSGTGGYISDCITAYHNQLGYTYMNVWITGNTCYDSRNHGIHVSGRDIHIEGNHVYNCGLTTAASNIYLGDYLTNPDCASNCTIKNNILSNCPIGGGVSIKISPYKPGGVSVSGNTGCTSIYWGSTCSQKTG